MQVNPQQFEQCLQQPLKNAWVLSGEEPLLINEAVDKLRNAAKRQGFEERIRFEVNKDFNWSAFLAETQELSLFSERKLIELFIPEAKPGTEGARQITQFCTAIPQDIVLLVICGKVDFKGGKPPAWYQAIEKAGVAMRIWQIERAKLPAWIKQRAHKMGMELDQQALELLVDRTDGNLLASAQELEKLSLLGLSGKISDQELLQGITDSSHHSIYDCIDMALSGNGEQTTKMFYSLKAEHFPEAIMVWALLKDLQKLEQLSWLKRKSSLTPQVMMRFQIWKQRQPIVNKALARHPYAFWAATLAVAAKLDRVQKGRQQAADLPGQILDLLLMISGEAFYQPENRLLARSGREYFTHKGML